MKTSFLLDKEHDSQLWLVLRHCRPWVSPGPWAGTEVLPHPTAISNLCLISGAEKRGFARTRNNSESARAPQNFDRKRQLSESQTETMSNSDSRINPRQLGTPRGGSYAAVPISGDRKNHNKPAWGKKKSIFEAYMSKEDVSAGLKRGELIQVPGT